MASSKTSEYYNTTCHVVDPDTVIVQGMRFVKERTCDDIGGDSFTCSKCGFDCYIDSPRDGHCKPYYCPECGAKVVE